MTEERLQKIMAQAGIGSRRACEELIEAGRVKVNGIRARLGDKADPAVDRITLDEQPLPRAEEKIYIALHKPRGVLSDTDPEDPRQTVFDLVPVRAHLFSVGRLDYDSEGLILLTNDGELANRLTHPRYGHEKEYRVLVSERPDQEQLEAWRRGVVLEDGTRTLPAQVEIESEAGKGVWLRIIMKEGRKRQIREVGKRIGVPVSRILRVRIGSLLLGNLKPREWRNLTRQEVLALQSGASRTAGKPAAPRRSGRETAPRDTPSEYKPPRRRGDKPTGSRPPRSGKPGEASTDIPDTTRPARRPAGGPRQNVKPRPKRRRGLPPEKR